MKQLLELPNVVAVGRGFKTKGGVVLPEEAVVVSVVVKIPRAELRPDELVPPAVDGIQTDVVETGVIRAFEAEPVPLERTTRERPALGGDSIGHYAITAGTLGALLYSDEGSRVILSNNHVLANSNAAAIGDPILQPGAHDGGVQPDDVIATLRAFVPIEFVGEVPSECPIGGLVGGTVNLVARALGRKTRLAAVRQAGENLVDAAIATPVRDEDVSGEIRGVGHIEGRVIGELGMPLVKSGRTTEVTTGQITQVDVTVQVQYGAGKVAVFTDQLMAGDMSAPGDSGSAVLSGNNLVGLLFAGSDTTTIINRAEHVLDALGLHL